MQGTSNTMAKTSCSSSFSWTKVMMASALLISGTNAIKPCLDPASDEYACVAGAEVWQMSALNAPTCDGLDTDDLDDLKACFDVIGRAGLKEVNIANYLVTTLPDDLFDGMDNLEELDIRSNDNLEELPVGLFKDTSNLVKLNLISNALKALPLGLFDGLTKLETLPLQYNKFTTLPAGIFDPLTSLVDLYLHGYDHKLYMQCLPDSTATNVRLATDTIMDGTCGCTPVEAVSCPESTVCTPGSKGYTCEGEAESACSNGLPGYDGSREEWDVCCPLECGGCGGKGCRKLGEEFGLGKKDCCIKKIIQTQPDCADSGSAPCVIASDR